MADIKVLMFLDHIDYGSKVFWRFNLCDTKRHYTVAGRFRCCCQPATTNFY